VLTQADETQKELDDFEEELGTYAFQSFRSPSTYLRCAVKVSTLLSGKPEDDAVGSTRQNSAHIAKQEDMKQIVKALRTLLAKLIDFKAGRLNNSWEKNCRSILGLEVRKVSNFTDYITKLELSIFRRANPCRLLNCMT
jgi:hypothetical protein